MCVYLFDCFQFFSPIREFSIIWRRHDYWWRASNFNLYSALIASEQGVFSCMPHLLCQETSVYTVIFEDPWHSHQLSSIWQFSCNYLFYRIKTVATWDRTPISCIRHQRSTNWATLVDQKKINVMLFITVIYK